MEERLMVSFSSPVIALSLEAATDHTGRTWQVQCASTA